MHLPSQWQVNRVHEKNIFFWRLSAVWLSDSAVGFSSHRHLLSWLYCLIELLFPFVLCGGVRQPSFPWKITSCWWLCYPKTWVLEFFSPQIQKLCLCCLEEGPWKWQKWLCPCSRGVTGADCLPWRGIFGYLGSGVSGCCLPGWLWLWRCPFTWLVEIQWLQGPVLRDISFCINVALGSFFPNIYKSAFLLQICLP